MCGIDGCRGLVLAAVCDLVENGAVCRVIDVESFSGCRVFPFTVDEGLRLPQRRILQLLRYCTWRIGAHPVSAYKQGHAMQSPLTGEACPFVLPAVMATD